MTSVTAGTRGNSTKVQEYEDKISDMTKSLKHLGLFVCASAQAVLAAHIDVDLHYAPLGGGIFQYELSVRNNGPNDVAIVSITDAPESDPLIAPTLEAPKGYGAMYDPGIGLGFGFVDLLEDKALFT